VSKTNHSTNHACNLKRLYKSKQVNRPTPSRQQQQHVVRECALGVRFSTVPITRRYSRRRAYNAQTNKRTLSVPTNGISMASVILRRSARARPGRQRRRTGDSATRELASRSAEANATRSRRDRVQRNPVRVNGNERRTRFYVRTRLAHAKPTLTCPSVRLELWRKNKTRTHHGYERRGYASLSRQRTGSKDYWARRKRPNRGPAETVVLGMKQSKRRTGSRIISTA